MTGTQEMILVLDFGSQYTQLIARRIREQHVYSEIKPFDVAIEEIKRLQPSGIILSGGPASVYQKNAPLVSRKLFDLNIPILGICYGLQLVCHLLGGKVARANEREYGQAELNILKVDPILDKINDQTKVWMSHGDRVEQIPEQFEALGETANSPYCIIKHFQKPIYGLQFHPEVAHTEQGKQILRNFIFDVAGCRGDWTPGSFISRAIESIRNQVGDANVICGLSGGVDSSVAAMLVHRAIGDQLTCVFVNNGLLRLGEAEEVREVFEKSFHLNFKYVDATHNFLNRLKGVTNPEEKRKIIGDEFIKTFEKAAVSVENALSLKRITMSAVCLKK